MSKYWNIPKYTQASVEELREKAKASTGRAGKKGQEYAPVTVEGRKICKTWWGEAWCANLEQYADYGSRLARGKRYVRTGTVIDLKIKGGKIETRVQGSRKVPYKVEIRISPLSEERCQPIIDKCGRKINNMESLVNGEFPEELKTLFTGNDGLFPTPSEISFSCSCPDWALMCKHVAASMYAIGVRLDENPFWFFRLRGLDESRFIKVALANKVEAMLENAEQPSERILTGDHVQDLFGVL